MSSLIAYWKIISCATQNHTSDFKAGSAKPPPIRIYLRNSMHAIVQKRFNGSRCS
jgi:hypothetical protein